MYERLNMQRKFYGWVGRSTLCNCLLDQALTLFIFLHAASSVKHIMSDFASGAPAYLPHEVLMNEEVVPVSHPAGAPALVCDLGQAGAVR